MLPTVLDMTFHYLVYELQSSMLFDPATPSQLPHLPFNNYYATEECHLTTNIHMGVISSFYIQLFTFGQSQASCFPVLLVLMLS